MCVPFRGDGRPRLIRALSGRFSVVVSAVVLLPGAVASAQQGVPRATPQSGSVAGHSDVSTDNPIAMPMVRIPAGSFQMGSPAPERFGQYSRCESPRHRVELTRDFRISQTEVTVGMFRRFVQETNYRTEAERSGRGVNGLDPSTGSVVRNPAWVWLSPGFEQTDEHPVVCVSHQDAMEFCRWLSDRTRSTFRLPTEAEWEYCCRAGSDEMFSSGDDVESIRRLANCGDHRLAATVAGILNPAPWDDDFAFTAPVGSFQPNDFGLQDMHGNVGEWCLDGFDPEYYSKSPMNDPTGPLQATRWWVVRGGSWYNAPISCRSSGRHDGVPAEASTTNGFRIVQEVPSGASR